MPPELSQAEDYELLANSEEHSMGFDEQYVKPETRDGDSVSQFIALGAALTTLVITWIMGTISTSYTITAAFLLVLVNDPLKFKWFALHPLLQTLAIALLTYGILTLQPTSRPTTKAQGLFRHQIAIFYLALPFITCGTLAVYFNKYISAKNHFVTWHGLLGIVCMAWILLQVAIGGASVWYGGAAFGGGMKAKAMWKYHRLSGYILFPMLLLTVNLGGAWSSWGQEYSAYLVRLVAFSISPLLILAAISTRVRTSKMKFW